MNFEKEKFTAHHDDADCGNGNSNRETFPSCPWKILQLCLFLFGQGTRTESVTIDSLCGDREHSLWTRKEKGRGEDTG
jgi:hypothetical protein